MLNGMVIPLLLANSDVFLLKFVGHLTRIMAGQLDVYAHSIILPRKTLCLLLIQSPKS